MRRLVLASASPSRRALLEYAGLAPEVVVSDVDEEGVDHLPATEAVAALARRKGAAVAERLRAADGDPPIVLACDSMLEVAGEAWSKADQPAEVIRRWRLMSGRTGRLHTGHFGTDLATGVTVERTDSTLIRFGRPTDAQIEAYAATPESRRVAGPFTLEGRSAPWVDSIDGNPGSVTGISLPVVASILAEMGVEITDLWT